MMAMPASMTFINKTSQSYPRLCAGQYMPARITLLPLKGGSNLLFLSHCLYIHWLDRVM